MTTQANRDESYTIPQHAGAQPIEQLALEIWKSCLASALHESGSNRITDAALNLAAVRANRTLGKVLGLSPRA